MAMNQPLNKFVVWAPDCTDVGAHERRLAVRQAHVKRVSEGGFTRAGGAILTSDSADAAPADRKFFGSCLIIEVESLQAARKLIESDIYYTSGVWDKEKIQILPILLANHAPPVQV